MIIRVTGIVQTNQFNHYPQQRQVTKYYESQTNKQVVKDDFGIVLDKEMQKLHFDKVV